jgi:uncharacterized protein (TIRG00374 family)
MNEQVKNSLSFLARFGFSGLLLWYLFSKIDWEKTISTLKSADPLYIFFGLLIFVVINGVILFRWAIFIRALDLSVPLRTTTRYFFIGLFGNLFLPSSIGGDIIKVLGLCRETPQKARVVASVLLDRLSGFAGIVIVAILAYAVGHQMIGDNSLMVPVIVMAVFSLVIVSVLFNEKVYSFGCRIFDRLPQVKKNLMQLHYDLMLLKGRQLEGWKAIGFSCLAQCLLALSYFYVAKALHQEIHLLSFIIFVPLICVASSLPSIGGLGVREAGAAYLFAKVGVDSGIAVSISLINFIFMVAIGLGGGLVYVATLSSGRLQYRQSASEIDVTKT